eukprot:UN21896
MKMKSLIIFCIFAAILVNARPVPVSQFGRRSLASGKCLVDNPSNAGRPLCFIDGKQVDTCSNTGCGGCCGSQCSWVGTYCNEADGVVAKCPGGYSQVGTLSANNDIRGTALGQSQQDSIADCKNLCDKDPNCVAFSYGGASKEGDSTLCQLSGTVTPNNNFGTNFRFCRKTVKCLQENPDNAARPLCFLNEVHQDTCSNKGCNGCCGSTCSWIGSYCSDRIVAECPSGYKQIGSLSENNDVKGRGLSQTQEDSIEDCQALCESTEGCVAFMYGGASTVHDSKLCQLSSSATPNNSFGSNFRFCQRLTSGNAPECAIMGSEHWSPNQVAPSSAASDAFDCQRQCQDLDSCFFWVFTGQCHLHGADAIFNTNDHTRNHGYITGPKFCENQISPHEQLKVAVKAAFDSIKSPENKVALPGLIRKAFHDAGHFDKNSGDVRMGCIQHFLTTCKQHANLEHAESVVKAVMNAIPSDMVLSNADAVQLLGALAVDELAQGTGAAPLYDRVRTGRLDPTAETCIDDMHMCDNLPDFSSRGHSADHDDIVISLNDVWVKEIEGKMINVNTLSKQDAVALIGAHTVGRVINFGPWTQQPFFLDNEYFLQLKRVKDWLDSGNSLGQGPFSQIVFPDWFMGSMEVEDSHPVMPPMNPFPQINQKAHIMMLDADLALVLNAPELVEKYAADNKVWRKDFDDAYIVMSELGFTSLDPPREGSNRRLLQRSEELLDEDFEFFQNLQILQEEQSKKIHAAFRGK